MRSRLDLFVLAVFLTLPACGGGGALAIPPVQSGQTDLRTLSGTILRADGTGLAGVTVTAGNPSTAVTDAGGNFIVIDPDAGTIPVEIDGTTSGAPGTFPVLNLMVDVNASGATALQPIILPDLSDPASANGTAPVDGTGTTTVAAAAVNPADNIRLDIPMGTMITIGGVPASGTVNLNVTPVSGIDVPMPLAPPGVQLDAAGFVTIQPGNAAFDTGGGQGVDVRLPNVRGFPVGTMVDIWSFDHDVGDWVDRTLETGNQGTVVDIGGGVLAIDSCGAITEGGWHTAVLPFVPSCGTTVTGRVLDQNSNPIANAHIALGTGQFGTTAADGTFSVASVPTYDPASLPACVISGTSLRALAPVALGAASTTINIAASTVVGGGTTNLGDIVVTVPNTGSLAGIVTDVGAGVAGATVSISGPTTTTATTGPTGTFFLANLAPGSYTASFQFAGAAAPTVRSFTITSNQITTVNIARITGTGSQTITVMVELGSLDRLSDHSAASGAKVLLIGTDPGSAGGILGVTNSSGRVTFTNVDGPFTVTAQLDVVDDGESGRLATTLFAIAPTDGTIGVPLSFDDNDDGGGFPAPDATLSGTVSNLPTLGTNENFQVDVRVPGLFQSIGGAQVNPATGAYTVPVPSGELLNVAFKHTTDAGLGGRARTIAGILVSGVGPVSAGGTVTQNFNFNVGRVDFNRAVTMTYTNQLSMPDSENVQLLIGEPSGGEASAIRFSVGVGTGLPGTIFLPSVSDSNLAGLRLDLQVEQSKNFPSTTDTDCDISLTANPTALTVNFEGVATVITPVDGSTLTTQQAAGMTVSFTESAGGLANGLNVFFIDSRFGTGLGLDIVSWTVFLPKGVTSATLPPTALPMFSDSTDYSLELTLVRFAENPGNFSSIFNENAFSNLDTFFSSTERQCFTDQDGTFSTGP